MNTWMTEDGSLIIGPTIEVRPYIWMADDDADAHVRDYRTREREQAALGNIRYPKGYLRDRRYRTKEQMDFVTFVGQSVPLTRRMAEPQLRPRGWSVCDEGKDPNWMNETATSIAIKAEQRRPLKAEFNLTDLIAACTGQQETEKTEKTD